MADERVPEVLCLRVGPRRDGDGWFWTLAQGMTAAHLYGRAPDAQAAAEAGKAALLQEVSRG